ncbi:MAG: hypothetical protein ACJA1B_000252 [Polaribacter sp.]|jgi:hypothetical protein
MDSQKQVTKKLQKAVAEAIQQYAMIADWETDFPNRNAIMMNALQNVHPSHLLDKNLYDFKNLESKISE